MLALCRHIIIISSDDEKILKWSQFAAESECATYAAFRSTLVKRDDGSLDLSARSAIDLDSNPMSGTLINLERSAPTDCYREAVDALASRLAQRFLTPNFLDAHRDLSSGHE